MGRGGAVRIEVVFFKINVGQVAGLCLICGFLLFTCNKSDSTLSIKIVSLKLLKY